MFTTPCIIRKNTPELRQKLEKLGYTNCIIEEEKYLFTSHGIFDCISSCTAYEDMVRNGLVDCGDNEQLFLALAAMRDDTDKDQYFVHDEEIHWVNQGAYIPKGSLFKCLVDKYYLDPDNTTPKFHRATVNEIIDYFQSQKS